MKKMIEVSGISMVFNMAEDKVNSLKEYVLKMVKGQLRYKAFSALTDVTFSVEKGDIFGIVGLNGSGKSTLLKLIAGILKPTKGSIKIHGSVAPLIELGAGFDMELTARENIYLNGSVLGYNKKFLDANFDAIVNFSEMAEFIDVPMKNYSSGMVARVAFSIVTVIRPDLLIVDEVLSVGDYPFQQKCERRINELMSSGTTVLFVSHDINQVMKLCRNAIWLEKGIVKAIGDTNTVCEKYQGKNCGEAE